MRTKLSANGMRWLMTRVFRVIVWSWLALGLTCLLIEGLLFGQTGGPRMKAAPIEHSLITSYGASLPHSVR